MEKVIILSSLRKSCIMEVFAKNKKKWLQFHTVHYLFQYPRKNVITPCKQVILTSGANVNFRLIEGPRYFGLSSVHWPPAPIKSPSDTNCLYFSFPAQLRFNYRTKFIPDTSNLDLVTLFYRKRIRGKREFHPDFF